jgi:hypothetical protein
LTTVTYFLALFKKRLFCLIFPLKKSGKEYYLALRPQRALANPPEADKASERYQNHYPTRIAKLGPPVKLVD